MATFGHFDQLGPFTSAIGGGWKLYHYSAGTSTLKDLYSDRAKTTTVAQPLLADANGVASYYADGLYKFVVKDSNDVTLYTWDNVFYGSIESTNHAEGVALASSSTLILGADGDYFHVTGTTTINALQGTQPFVFLTFDSALTLTHSASLVLKGGVNHPVIAGETLIFINDGANVFREVDNGLPTKDANNTWTGTNTFNGIAAFGSSVALNSTATAQTPTLPSHIATKSFVEKRVADTFGLSNGNIGTGVSSNAITLSILTADGSTPTAENVVSVPFRAGTLPSSGVNVRTVTAATTLTISAGSTLGFTSSQLSRIYIVALDNAGVVELGAYHPLSGTNHLPLNESLFYSSTAEGGAGGADSAQVIYSTTARTSVPITILGFIDIQTGATAGNWSNGITHIHLISPSTPRSGQVIQRLMTVATALDSTGTAIPNDDTIPQNTEGKEFQSLAITPKHAADLLLVAHVGVYGGSVASQVTAALFQDSTANALSAVGAYIAATATATETIPLMYQTQAATTSATTFKIRGGANTGTCYFNGFGSGTRAYGGVCNSALAVMEIFL